MTQRRAWTQEQDDALKYLKNVLLIKQWSEISRRLEFQHNIPGRNGKQCRERYINHLKNMIICQKLTSEEQKKLFQLHDKIGNRWSHICKQFKGRTDNHVKNHFHSKLRKAIRKLNKEIKINFKKTVKPFKLSIIYKIVEASDFRFSKELRHLQKNLVFFNALKNLLIEYAEGIVQNRELIGIKQNQQAVLLISQLQAFERQFKQNRIRAMAKKIQKENAETTVLSKSRGKAQTSASQYTFSLEDQQKRVQIQEGFQIEEDISIQFINGITSVNKRLYSMQDQTGNSHIEEKTNGEKYTDQAGRLEAKRFDSFSNRQIQYRGQSNKNQVFLQSLICQSELLCFSIERKFSIDSFQSLRQFEDSFLDQQQINTILKRFDDFSNIEEGLFE